MRFYIGGFYENLQRKSKSGYNRTKISGNLHDELRTFEVLTAVLNICISTTEKFHVNNEHIVGSYMYVNNNTKGTIVAFQCQRERDAVLRYTYIAHLVQYSVCEVASVDVSTFPQAEDF